jgi:CHAT domain-containing protein/Tfp pilus assembly protein PilF
VKQKIAGSLTNIGILYHQQGNFEQALDYYHKALAIDEESGDKMEAASDYEDMGILFRQQGKADQALEYHQKALATYESVGAKSHIALSLSHIADVYRVKGDSLRALDYYERSLKIGEDDKSLVATVLNNRALVYLSQGNYSQVLVDSGKAGEIARDIGKQDSVLAACENQGRAYRARREYQRARQAFDDAITTAESMRLEVAGGELERARFFEDKVSPYAEIISVLTEQNQIEETFQYAERSRARVLLDVMRSGRIDITRAMNPGEHEHEIRLTRDLAALNGQLSQERRKPRPDAARIADLDERLRKARLDRESFETALYASHPELRVERGESQPVKLDQIGPLLAEANGAALEYVVGEDESFLIALNKPSQSGTGIETRVYRIEMGRKALTDLVGQFRQRLANHDLGFQELAARLYSLLIKPAEQQLNGKRLLILVPDQVLWSLPFQALKPSENRYLLEDHAISYAPSLTVLCEMVKSGKQRKATVEPSNVLLAVGNPDLGKKTAERARSVLMDETLEPLPEAERQVKELGQLYGSAHSRVYTGPEAREDVVKTESSKYRIVHLATHGVLNDAAPMYSHVVLSQQDSNGSEDGLLEAWEIMKLDLRADLVVLSACETARGKIARGEGVIGLTWALFVAGCPSTVVSQWKVESASTTELMLELHRQLRSTEGKPRAAAGPEETVAAKAESLRHAALKLLKTKKYSHPFYWAGFVVVGNPF